MIRPAAYKALANLSRELHECGWTTGRCESFVAESIGRILQEDKKAQRDMQDMEAANLRHLGLDVISQRQGCSRSSADRRAKRGRKLSRIIAASGTE